MEPTQADQNEDNVDWLPEGLICVRTDTDLPVLRSKSLNILYFKVTQINR